MTIMVADKIILYAFSRWCYNLKERKHV